MTYTIFSMRPVTEKVGQIKTNGEIYATSGVYIGSISVDGRIRTSSGLLLGIVTGDGRISSDILDLKEFKVSRKGHVLKGNVTVGAVKQTDKGIPEKYAYWGSCALFFYNTETLVAKEKKKKEPNALTQIPAPPPTAAPPVQRQYVNQVPTTRLSAANMPADPNELFTLGQNQPAALPPNPIEIPITKDLPVQLIEKPVAPSQSEVKTVRMPTVQALENYAELRKQAFFDRKRKTLTNNDETS